MMSDFQTRPAEGDMRLGPLPQLSLEAFADLGISDKATARYFHIEVAKLKSLQLEFGIRRAARWRHLMPRLTRLGKGPEQA